MCPQLKGGCYGYIEQFDVIQSHSGRRQSECFSPRGGGGGHFHICSYWVGAIWETPIFSPKFPLQSISFSQMAKKSAPEHHHFTYLPLRRTSFSKFLYLQAVPSPPTAGSLAANPGVTASQSAGQTHPTSQFRRGADPHFTLKPAPEPPIFHFAVAHTYQNVGQALSPCPPGLQHNIKLFLPTIENVIGQLTDMHCITSRRGQGSCPPNWKVATTVMNLKQNVKQLQLRKKKLNLWKLFVLHDTQRKSNIVYENTSNQHIPAALFQFYKSKERNKKW